MIRGLIVVVAALLVLAACGDSGDEGIEPVEVSTTSSSSTTLSPEEQEKQKVREAIQEWDALVTEMNRDPDPSNPRIDDVLTDRAAEELRNNAQKSQQEQLATRPAEDHPVDVFEVESIDLNADPVTVTACARNNAVLRRAGEVINDEFEAAGYEVEVTREDGTYQVSSSVRVSYVAKPAGTPQSEVQCEEP